MPREYIIYTDESVKDGAFFGNFYGGVLLRSSDLESVTSRLRSVATAAGLTREIKWQKVSSGYLDRYVSLMDAFFDLICESRIKARVMFTQNRHVAQSLDEYHRSHQYHLLYFQFLKHAFGLAHANPNGPPIKLRIYLDQLPDTREKNAQFKGYLAGLERSPDFRKSRILVPLDQIAEVDSRKHIVLQCLDVLLGSMQFRLNNWHRQIPDGSLRRGARTVAKDRLFAHISRRIRKIYPHFNIGESTGTEHPSDRFKHPYRHWKFISRDSRIDPALVKPKRK